jgi:hypothetical protein
MPIKEGKMTVTEETRIGWGALAGKLLVCVLPIVLLALIFPFHPRIASGGGIVIGSILQRYAPPRSKGRRDMWIILFACVGGIVIALIPKAWL